jgi:hypothetical protein
MASVVTGRSGVRIDAALLDYELSRRGLTARRLAALAGISEVLLSRARHGGQMRESTFIKITVALATVPPLFGADALVAVPETKRSRGTAGAGPRGGGHARP